MAVQDQQMCMIFRGMSTGLNPSHKVCQRFERIVHPTIKIWLSSKPNQLSSSKYLLLSFAEKSYKFGTTWGVNDDNIFIFRSNIHLKCLLFKVRRNRSRQTIHIMMYIRVYRSTEKNAKQESRVYSVCRFDWAMTFWFDFNRVYTVILKLNLLLFNTFFTTFRIFFKTIMTLNCKC